MKVILGLGNPGLKYRVSRHNLGFLVIEKLAQENKIRLNTKTARSLTGLGRIAGRQVCLVEPLTFVNLSGEAVVDIIYQKKIQLSDLLVICDDVNLPLGKMRIRSRGSHGGHNGLRSIIQSLGSSGFARLRIGVGKHPRAKQLGLTGHVLGKFKKAEIKLVQQAIEQALDCIQLWLTKGIEPAMNQFNRR